MKASKQPTQLVLLSEEDQVRSSAMMQGLQLARLEAYRLSEAESVLAAFDATNPCLLVLGTQPDNADPFMICHQIRVREGGASVPIVLITDSSDAASMERAFEVGATDFFSRTEDWSSFGHRIRHVLRASETYQRLGEVELQNAALLRAIPNEIFVLRDDGAILEYFPGDDAHTMPPARDGRVYVHEYLPAETAKQIHQVAQAVCRTRENMQFEFSQVGRNGSRSYHSAQFVPYMEDRVLVIATEITDRKRSEKRIHKLAYFDQLTGLPNRQYFMQHLSAMIESARERDAPIALFYVDLDNFKRINDNLGHSYGDGVLKAVATRLSGCMRGQYPSADGVEDSFGIARLGGDEFVAAVADVGDEGTLTRIAERIRHELREPLHYEGHEFVLTPSVGIATYPQDGDCVEDLLKHADVALYQAKGAGRDSIRFYRNTMSLRSMQRLELETKLRHTIEQGELELHYQPKYDLEQRTVTGVEALVRWRDEDGQYIPPVQFIPIAEESGLITSLGEWVLHAACTQVRDWQKRLGVDVPTAVNISSHQLYHCDLSATVMRALFEASVRPDLLELEITESLLMRDAEDTIATLVKLKDAGVSLAIDDFGTGYSSLSYLKKFPLDALKIDRTFVMDLEGDDDDAVICKAIIAMAHSLGLKVIGEGIETKPQLEFLRSNGCDQGQGYFLGRPVCADELEAVLTPALIKQKRGSRLIR